LRYSILIAPIPAFRQIYGIGAAAATPASRAVTFKMTHYPADWAVNRNHARGIAQSIGSGGSPPTPGEEDLPGYLGPAVGNLWSA
jgi:hypothetical protein